MNAEVELEWESGEGKEKVERYGYAYRMSKI